MDPAQPLPVAGVLVQKHHIGLYLFCVYTDPAMEAWFRDAWTKKGMRLDMGKSCVRVRTLDEVPLEVLGRLFAKLTARKFLASYEAALPARTRCSAGARKK